MVSRSARRAGEYDAKVGFLRTAPGETSRGEKTNGGTLTTICEAWADINYGTGVERRQVGADSATLKATLRVRTTEKIRSITTDDLIEFDGAKWNITSAVPWKRSDIDFTAIRRL